MTTTYLNLGMEVDYDGACPVTVNKDTLIPGTHEYLFNFLDADLSRIENYAEKYLGCIDLTHPEKSSHGDKAILQRMLEELTAMHPFFSVFPQQASRIINIAFAGYLQVKFPRDKELQLKMFDLIKSDKFISDADPGYWFDYLFVSAGKVFGSLFDLQENISTWVFMTIDNTNTDLAKLSAKQRTTLYSTLYHGTFAPLLETRLEYGMNCPSNLKRLEAEMDFGDEKETAAIFSSLAAMQKNPSDKTPENIQKLIATATGITEDCEYKTYITENLEDILKLEVCEMAQSGIRIKRCKNCGRYFILEKGNMEYCDRIAPGETKPCSEIGKARTYEKRVADDNGLMAIYRKSYKTHYARILAEKISKNDFEKWKKEALKKRDSVKSGKLGLEEYSLWLKK